MPGNVLNAFLCMIRRCVLPPPGGGVYSYIPILKIKKLRPEVTGVGHELRRTALAGDALLHPLGLSGLDLHPGGTQRVRGELRG